MRVPDVEQFSIQNERGFQFLKELLKHILSRVYVHFLIVYANKAFKRTLHIYLEVFPVRNGQVEGVVKFESGNDGIKDFSLDQLQVVDERGVELMRLGQQVLGVN